MSDLPAGWAVAPLGDLVRIRDSERIPVNQKERAERLGKIPYYGATGRVGWIDEPIFNEDLLLLGEDGVQFFDPNKPKAYLVSGPSWVNNHAHVLQSTAIDRRYLKHFLDQADYRGLATGTTRLKLTQAAMKRVPVRVAPLPEQLRIVDELERRLAHLDAALRGLRSALRRLVVARSAIGHELFWKSGNELSPLSELLSEKLANGHSVTDRPGGFPVLRLTCLKEGRIDLSETKEGAWDRSEAQKYLVRQGDFLVSRGNGSIKLVARGGLVASDPAEVAYPDTLIRVRVDRSKMLPEYLAAAWASDGVRRQLEAVAQTTAGIYKVNQDHLRLVKLPVPALEAQGTAVDEFDRRTSLIDAAERTIRVSLAKAEQLRRSLLAAAFSGDLVPQDPGDEPADVLLERMRAERAATPKPTRRRKKEPAA